MHSDIKINICLKEAAEHLHFSAMYFCDYIRFILDYQNLQLIFVKGLLNLKSLVAEQIILHLELFTFC